MRKIILILIFFLLIFLGCIRKPQVNIPPLTPVSATPEGTLISTDPCIGFVCKNKSSVWTFLGLARPSLAGGSCKVVEYNVIQQTGQVDPEVEKEINRTINMSDFYFREFMIGEGSIPLADEARRYCDGNIGIAIEWLGKNNTEMPKGLSKDESKKLECTLKKDTIPIVIYGTGFITEPPFGIAPLWKGQVENSYVKSLAENLSGVGPVFVSIGIELTKDKIIDEGKCSYCWWTRAKRTGGGITFDNTLGHPFNEIIVTKHYCTNCLVAIFVNDTETVSKLATKKILTVTGQYSLDIGDKSFPPGSDINVSTLIDAIIYRINFSDFNCGAEDIELAIEDFSRNVSTTLKRPSIVILSAKKDSFCTDENIAKVYNYIYTAIPALADAGVIGIVQEDGAINVNESGEIGEAGRAWFGNCKIYYNQTDPDKAALVPIFFAGGTQPYCGNRLLNPAMFIYAGASQYKEQSVVPLVRGTEESCADLCIENNYLFPYSQAIKPQKYPPYCNTYSFLIREFSYESGVDPSIISALIWSDSNFDTSKWAMIGMDCNGQQLDRCDNYEGQARNICRGIEKFRCFYEQANSTLANLNIGPSCCDASNDIIRKLYFSILGYKEGQSNFNNELNNYIRCVKNACCPQYDENKNFMGYGCSYTFDNKYLDIIRMAQGIREICNICK